MYSSIVVIGKNREIGCNNQLLWDLPEDMARFKEITMGHPVIVGYNTFLSFGSKPLPGRTNVIVNNDTGFRHDTCPVAYSLEEAYKLAEKAEGSEEIFIIGGASIYEQTIDKVDKLYLTVVDDSPEADTFFPKYDKFTNEVYRRGSSMGDLKYTFLELTK